MKILSLKYTHYLFFLIIISASIGCSSKWTKEDFDKYSKTKQGANKFEFKSFATEINLKWRIVCEDYLESKSSIDVFPAREVKEYMEKKYGVIIDISEFEKLRKNGNLKFTISKTEDGEKQALFDQKYMALDGAFPSKNLPSGLVSSRISAYWSEYKEPLSWAYPWNKIEMGKNDQMQVLIALAPVGPYIAVYLRVRDGEPDEKGYYKLKMVAEEEFKINFPLSKCNTADLAEHIKQLPVLLKELK
jgi:hypothetical protein